VDPHAPTDTQPMARDPSPTLHMIKNDTLHKGDPTYGSRATHQQLSNNCPLQTKGSSGAIAHPQPRGRCGAIAHPQPWGSSGAIAHSQPTGRRGAIPLFGEAVDPLPISNLWLTSNPSPTQGYTKETHLRLSSVLAEGYTMRATADTQQWGVKTDGALPPTSPLHHDLHLHPYANADASRPFTTCSVVERVNRTPRDKLYRYFTYNNTYTYIDILPKFVKGYNATVHSTTGMAPGDVRDNEVLTICNKMRGKVDRARRLSKLKFRVGQHVRISKEKAKFAKGGEQNYTTEIFKVRKIVYRTLVPCSNSRSCVAKRSKASFTPKNWFPFASRNRPLIR